MAAKPILYRKRYFPKENIHLKDDIILKLTDDIIVTRWNTLKPRKDIAMGISAYFLKEGYKISKIYNANHELVYWYCDIIEAEHDSSNNIYTFHDLLVDILIYPDGRVQVVDLDELGDLLEDGTITPFICTKALRISNKLLTLIYHDRFQELTKIIEELE